MFRRLRYILIVALLTIGSGLSAQTTVFFAEDFHDWQDITAGWTLTDSAHNGVGSDVEQHWHVVRQGRERTLQAVSQSWPYRRYGLVSPDLVLPTAYPVMLTFRLSCSGLLGNFDVGLILNHDSLLHHIVPLVTGMSAPAGGEEVRVSLSGYEGQTVNVVFTARGSRESSYSSTDVTRYTLADVSIEMQPLCKPARSLMLVGLGPRSARVSWQLDGVDFGHIPGQFNVRLLSHDAEVARQVFFDTAVCTFTGLVPGRQYTVEVESDCQNNYSGTAPPSALTFVTPAVPQPLPYSQPFDSLADLDEMTAVHNVKLESSPAGGYQARFSSSASSIAYLMLPPFDARADSLEVSFTATLTDIYDPRYSAVPSDTAKLRVGYALDPARPEQTFVECTNPCYLYFKDLNNERRLVFRTKSANPGWGFKNVMIMLDRNFINRNSLDKTEVVVDDILVQKLPTCVPPASFVVNAADTMAVVTWSAHSAREVLIELRDADTQTLVNTYHATGIQYVITGLERGHNYSVALRAVCGAGDTTNVGFSSSQFSTYCSAQPLPYVEGFEPGGRAHCWTKVDITTSARSNSYTDPLHYHGTASMPLEAGLIVLTPELVGDSLHRYELNLMAYGTKVGDFADVGVMLDPLDIGSYQPLAAFAITTPNRWQQVTIPLTTLLDPDYIDFIDARYLTFLTAGNTIYIDNIELRPSGSCLAPQAVSVMPESDTAVTVVITPNPGDSLWLVTVNGSRFIVNQPVSRITGLSPNRLFDVTAATICGPDTSLSCSAKPENLTCWVFPEDKPYYEPFDSPVSLLCWSELGFNPVIMGAIWLDSAARCSGSSELVLHYEGGVSPSFGVDSLSRYTLSGLVHSSQAETAPLRLDVGVMLDTADISTYEFIDSVTVYPQTPCQPFSVSFASLALPINQWVALARRIVLLSPNGRLFVDNLMLDTVAHDMTTYGDEDTTLTPQGAYYRPPLFIDFNDSLMNLAWHMPRGPNRDRFIISSANYVAGGDNSLFVDLWSYHKVSSCSAWMPLLLDTGLYLVSYDWLCDANLNYGGRVSLVGQGNGSVIPIMPAGRQYLNRSPHLSWTEQVVHVTSPGVYNLQADWSDYATTLTFRLDNISIRPLVPVIVSDTLCHNTAYTAHGARIPPGVLQPGDTVITLITGARYAADPDTIFTLRLHIEPARRLYYRQTLFFGVPYSDQYFNIPCPETGPYQRVIHTSSGCDSVVRLTINVVQPFDTICEGETAHFFGHDFTESGNYAVPVTNEYGAVDTLYLYLTVIEAGDTVDTTICHNLVYSWAGYKINRSGTYHLTKQTSSGCPFTRLLRLTVLPRDSFLNITICRGGMELVYDTFITQTGRYTFHRVINDCDVNFHVTARVIPPPEAHYYYDACEGIACSFMGFAGKYLTHDTTAVFTTVIPGTLCDSLTYVHVKYHPTQRTHLYVNIHEGEVYEWNDNSYTRSGDYTERFSDQYGCDSIATLHLYVQGLGLDRPVASKLILEPNPVGRQARFHIHADDIVRVEIVSATGAMVARYDCAPDYEAPHEPGIYFVRTVSRNGTVNTEKLIVGR